MTSFILNKALERQEADRLDFFLLAQLGWAAQHGLVTSAEHGLPAEVVMQLQQHADAAAAAAAHEQHAMLLAAAHAQQQQEAAAAMEQQHGGAEGAGGGMYAVQHGEGVPGLDQQQQQQQQDDLVGDQHAQQALAEASALEAS